MATQEGPRAFTCSERGHAGSRNLIVCIDEMSNRFGTKNTLKFYRDITKNYQQRTYYNDGLAEFPRPSLGYQLSYNLDMITGRNLHKIIMDCYRWLSDQYRNGDRIFLFGSSRGAYQVLGLAGMIARVGLLLPGNNEQIPFAFELYSKTDDDDPNMSRPASVVNQPVTKESMKRAKYAELAKTFQRTFCRANVHIHFVGVWDAVSSVGLWRKTLPCTTSYEHICYFRHALAWDERRVKSLPKYEYEYGGRCSGSEDGRIKEIWFTDRHENAGSSSEYNENIRSEGIPLLWMRNQAVAAGLEMVQ